MAEKQRKTINMEPHNAIFTVCFSEEKLHFNMCATASRSLKNIDLRKGEDSFPCFLAEKTAPLRSWCEQSILGAALVWSEEWPASWALGWGGNRIQQGWVLLGTAVCVSIRTSQQMFRTGLVSSFRWCFYLRRKK